MHPTNRPLSKTNVFSPPSGVNRNICNNNSFNGKSGNSGNALSKCGERDGASFNKRSASSAGNSYRASNKRPESVLSSGALYPANSPASEECTQRKVRFGVQNVEGFEGKKLDRSFRKSYGSVMSSAGGLSQSVHIRGGKERDKPIRCATSSGKRTANNLHRKKWAASEAASFSKEKIRGSEGFKSPENKEIAALSKGFDGLGTPQLLFEHSGWLIYMKVESFL